MTKTQIYIVYSCDEWVSTSSQRLLMCTTDEEVLCSYIAKKIQSGDFEYNNPEWSKEEQVSDFEQDFYSSTRAIINSKLKYGYYDYCYDGEEI